MPAPTEPERHGHPLTVDLAAFDWARLRWGTAARRVPAIVVCILIGLYLHQPAAGMVAAGAALPVGFASVRRIRNSRFVAMGLTAAAMAFSAWAGTLAGNSHVLGPLVAALGAFVFALLTIYDDNVGWVAMQAVVALVVATAFPSHGFAALERSLAILAGGVIQMAILAALWGVLGMTRQSEAKERAKPGPLEGYIYHWEHFAKSLAFRSTAFHYAVRVALTVVVAVEAARYLPVKNSYWLAMTTVVVLKPDFYRTYSGGVQRVAGTLLGVIVASVLAYFFRPTLPWLVVLTTCFSLLTFAFQKVNPTVFAACLTAYIVFLIAITGLPEASVTGYRLVNTALGCAVALVSQFVGYRMLLRLFPFIRVP